MAGEIQNMIIISYDVEQDALMAGLGLPIFYYSCFHKYAESQNQKLARRKRPNEDPVST
jgi:hypothetical protein